MRFLLDTHVLLWAAGLPQRLSPVARDLLSDPANDLVHSAANLWEIAIKRTLGRADFAVDVQQLRRGLLENGYQELAVDGRHALAVTALPSIHRDPFDRILLAQAVVEGITLLTADETLAGYPGPVRRV